MIELWSWPSPNGRPVHILLEETGLPYRVKPVNDDGAPNKKIPAIVDRSGANGQIKLSESAAILIYLAEKAENFIPTDPAARYLCLQWTMFQISGLGPAFQNYHYFNNAAPEKSPVAIKRFTQVIKRLAGVLEKRLDADDYLAGNYSIADMAVYPSIASASIQAINLDSFQATRRWADKMAARPAVARGMALLQELVETKPSLSLAGNFQ